MKRKLLLHLTDTQLSDLLNTRIHLEHKTIAEVKTELGVSQVTILNWCKHFGLPLPMKRRVFKHLTDKQFKELLYTKIWVENKSVETIKRELDMSTPAIFDWCNRFGIPTRNGSEANLLRFAKATKEELQAITAKAHAAVRGTKRTRAERIKIAKAVQQKAIMSKWEKWFATWLTAENITNFIFDYAIDVFNIDFAFPTHKIAIEIDGGNWHTSARKVQQDTTKTTYLTEQGWTIYRISTRGYINKTNEYSTAYKQRATKVIKLIKPIVI